MMDLETIFRTIDELTPDEKQQVIEYIQQRQGDGLQKSKTRIPGLFPGIWMSGDFDDALPDSFWLGEK